ncbi:CPL (NUC119) domain-containing protein [Elsinoe fawcettii]|nr:CPL (NUC119) domain-containing protein [Elsinoe fawcettii]
MAGVKRRADGKTVTGDKQNKKLKTISSTKKEESAASSDEHDLAEFSSEENGLDDTGARNLVGTKSSAGDKGAFSKGSKSEGEDKKFKVETTSAEAHAKQRALAKERKANKPNADLIARSKKIWERLRRKSHVPLEERKKLVEELYVIINGRVRDFVFKHDSVRVIQCALKYANKEQRLNITRELQADMRALAESKYGKFMVAKIVMEGDQEVKNLVIPEFYGHIRRLINHPEAAWIVDDIYRQVASSEQKAIMLREWYGAEFAIENKIKDNALKKKEKPTAELSVILTASPEKRKPIMQNLYQLINQLVQKKMTGFTMLHDAMHQYYINTSPGSEEANEFLENLKSDLDEASGGGDLLKNLAFTKNGSKVVCLALAYGTAKDRKQILRVYKDTVELMALDAYAYQVLLAALEVTDDTRTSGKAVFSELLFETITDLNERDERLITILTHRTGRLLLLFPLAGDAKWLIPTETAALLAETHAIRATTSKKASDVRRAELAAYLAAPLLALIDRRAEVLCQSIPGCQAVAELLLSSTGHDEEKQKACAAIAAVCAGDPAQEGHISHLPAAGKMLRNLCQGGKFDAETKTVVKPEQPLGFAKELYTIIKGELEAWATGPSSFVVVALVEGDELGKEKADLLKVLKKSKKVIEKAVEGKGGKPNAGSKIILEKL